MFYLILKNIVHNFESQHRIDWHWFYTGGTAFRRFVEIFDIAIHFKHIVGEYLFTSRSIIAISIDPNDLLASSPAHYLIYFLPEKDLLSTLANQLPVWQHITKVRQDFWSQWHLEFK